VATNGGFNADAAGYIGGKGKGKGVMGAYGGGSSYGGAGGQSAWYGIRDAAGSLYGNSNAPAFAGSGSSIANEGPGGGFVRVVAAQSVTMNGTITANGDRPGYYVGAAVPEGPSGSTAASSPAPTASCALTAARRHPTAAWAAAVACACGTVTSS